jgi:hypothetical protein
LQKTFSGIDIFLSQKFWQKFYDYIFSKIFLTFFSQFWQKLYDYIFRSRAALLPSPSRRCLSVRRRCRPWISRRVCINFSPLIRIFPYDYACTCRFQKVKNVLK